MHGKNGVYVYTLHTGKLLFEMILSQNKLYDDINGDNIIDTIEISQKSNYHHPYDYYLNYAKSESLNVDKDLEKHKNMDDNGQCHLHVSSGLPSKETLFSQNICDKSSKDSFDTKMKNKSQKSKNQQKQEKVVALTSVILNKDKQNNYINHHYHDFETARRLSIDGGRHGLKSFFICLNNGKIFRYRGNGNKQWEKRGLVKWSQGENAFVELIESTSQEWYRFVNDKQVLLAVIGPEVLSLINTETGTVLNSYQIPIAPIYKPIIGDFDNDGYPNIILFGKDACISFSLKEDFGDKVLLTFVLLCLPILAFIKFFVINIPKYEVEKRKENKFFHDDNSKRSMKKNFLFSNRKQHTLLKNKRKNI